MAARIRKDDIVMVISGDHKGARGKVLRVIPDRDQVVIEGVNLVYRHVRRSQKNPQGGRIQKEAPLPACKVMPIDRKTDRPTRVRFEVQRDAAGKVTGKRRIATGRKSSGEEISVVTRHTRSAPAAAGKAGR
ncbi:MAG: 50S ribosomal protein L24 [Phycisphaerales bacterium]|nr:50S ribosomal protein L24 [Phycisphaerales bacterium]